VKRTKETYGRACNRLDGEGMLNAQMVEDSIPLIREAVKRMKKVAVIIRTGGIEHAAIC